MMMIVMDRWKPKDWDERRSTQPPGEWMNVEERVGLTRYCCVGLLNQSFQLPPPARLISARAAAPPSSPRDAMVFVTAGGQTEVYHPTETCFGARKANKLIEMSRDDAQSKGLRKCWCK